MRTNLRNDLNLIDGDYFRDGILQSSAQTVVVRSPEDISGTLDSSKVYVIDGVVDMGDTPIFVPEGGLAIEGYGFGISQLFSSSAGYEMFVVDPAGGYSGNLFLNRMEISCTGVGSKVFNLDNQNNGSAAECTTVNFLFTEDLGELTAYRQVLWENVALVDCVTGLTLSGNMIGGLRATTAIVVDLGSDTFTGTVFKAGTGLVIQRRVISDMNAEDINAAGAFCDFAPSNIVTDARFLMFGVSVNPAANAFPNMPSESVKARFQNCLGVRDTYPGGVVDMDTEVATTFTSADTLEPIASTGKWSNLEWFEENGDNGLLYISGEEIEIEVSGTLSFTGSNNREMAIQVRQWDDSASQYVNIGPEYKATLNGGAAGTRAENLSFGAYAIIEENDRIELWIKNITDTNSITASAGGEIRVKER